MQVLEGSSQAIEPERAVAEAVAGWPVAGVDLVLVFTSPVRSASEVAAAIAARYPDAQVVGCTTAGEHLSGMHSTGGLVMAGLTSPRMAWATALVDELATVDAAGIRATVDGLFARLAIDRAGLDARRYFCLLFIDGLSGAEERVAPIIADALDGIALIGGSAGDDLAFARTEVIHGDRARSGAAVLALCRSDVAFHVLQHQHFSTTSRLLAITKVEGRRVHEIDGEPAAVAYARALGIARVELTPRVAFDNPLAFRYHGVHYVRAIREIHADDSISFYCAIEEGMVVDIGAHTDLVPALGIDLAHLAGDEPIDLLIGSNCILRALETKRRDQHGAVGALFQRFSRHMIGFDTYGEQLAGLHMNQTLVALALCDRAEVT